METGRNANGTFTKGHRFAKGNPFARQQGALRTQLYAAVTTSDFKDILDKLLALAKEGNIPAAKLLLEHLIGKPVQAVHLSGPDGEKLEGISLGDVQLAVVEALADEPAARVKVAAKLKELHERASRNGEPA